MEPLRRVSWQEADRKSTRLNSSHVAISYAVFCLIALQASTTLVPYTTLFRSIYMTGKLVAHAVIRILRRGNMPLVYHSYFTKLIKGIGAFIATIIFLNLIGYGALAASLVAGGGLTAVMIGFAFKDIGENFLAGFFLAFSRSFRENDLIETGG